jgi:hypothetical protein
MPPDKKNGAGPAGMGQISLDVGETFFLERGSSEPSEKCLQRRIFGEMRDFVLI